MADPDLTPEALKRLCERLRDQTSNEDSAALEDEAAAAISGLMAARDARDGEIAAAVECCKDYAAAREQAEAKLRQIASYCADCLPETATTLHAVARARADKIYRIGQYANGETDSIARSASQGGEG